MLLLASFGRSAAITIQSFSQTDCGPIVLDLCVGPLCWTSVVNNLNFSHQLASRQWQCDISADKHAINLVPFFQPWQGTTKLLPKDSFGQGQYGLILNSLRDLICSYNNNSIFISYIKYTNITPPANSKANRGRWCVDGLRFITNSWSEKVPYL